MRRCPSFAKREEMANLYVRHQKQADPRLPQVKSITVGVFPPDDNCHAYMAYTRWYTPQWPGCCEHTVMAINGTEAKKIAIKEHKENCHG